MTKCMVFINMLFSRIGSIPLRQDVHKYAVEDTGTYASMDSMVGIPIYNCNH